MENLTDERKQETKALEKEEIQGKEVVEPKLEGVESTKSKLESTKPKLESTKPKLDYIVLGSGSSGNAVRIGDIMIDCGLPYPKMKEELKKCKALFITHKHGDHLRKETFKKIKQHHRRLKIFGNWQVAEVVSVDHITNRKSIKMNNWVLTPFEVPHDVVTQGVVINFDNGLDVIYVTDSAGNKEWKKGKYDYLFLESNHDENIINQVKTSDYKYDVVAGAKRHTSTQESKAFYYLNRKNKDSEWIELHKSGRFY